MEAISKNRSQALITYADIFFFCLFFFLLLFERCMFIKPCNSTLSSHRTDNNLMAAKGHFNRDQSRLMFDS